MSFKIPKTKRWCIFLESIKKPVKAIILIIFLFLIGNFISFIGLAKGHDIATTLSRPWGSNVWETSGEMIIGCTYTPVIMGVSLILLSLLFSTVLFIEWIRSNQ